MFILNPHDNPDALWQHSVMVLGAAVIGYIIGHLDTKKVVRQLETKVLKLDTDLEKQHLKNKSFSGNVAFDDMPTTESFSKVKADDLKKIEGINDEIEALLNSDEIYTYQQLSETNAVQLNEILQQADIQFQTHEPQTWPQQAQLASNGLWEELKELQNELSKSRY